MAQLWTEDPRLAGLYDTECAGRHDHDFYLALAAELRVSRAVDIGCGTGVFVVDLASRGVAAVGVDPALPMLDIARTRAGGDAGEWIHGVADDVPTASAELVVLMGHVAQYFIEDHEWAHLLGEVHRILLPGGWLAFETRDPRRDWPGRWTKQRTEATLPHPGGGEFTSWVEVVDVSGAAASYTTTHVGHSVLPDGSHLTATETLRFRSEDEIRRSLEAAGFAVARTWGAWDGSPTGDSSDELIVLAARR